MMKSIANILFEAKMLKEIPRSGFHFLGAGKESVAEHSFSTTFVAFVMSQLEPDIDALKLISMCLVHDLPEARIGDLNAVQKNYVRADDAKAVEDMTNDLPFGAKLADLIREFNEAATAEAKLAKDADQLGLILELKQLSDTGFSAANQWLENVLARLQTKTGRTVAAWIMDTRHDAWWLDKGIDRLPINQ
jgi:putative hydrolase of HD superfamily